MRLLGADQCKSGYDPLVVTLKELLFILLLFAFPIDMIYNLPRGSLLNLKWSRPFLMGHT